MNQTGGRISVQGDHPSLNRCNAMFLRRPGVAKKFKAEVLAEAKVGWLGPDHSFILLSSSEVQGEFPGNFLLLLLINANCLSTLAWSQVCDLALLTVNDDSFWNEGELRALEFVEVPELQVCPA